jgi:hypothetical protein
MNKKASSTNIDIITVDLGIELDPENLSKNLDETRRACGDCVAQDVKPLIEGAPTDPW